MNYTFEISDFMYEKYRESKGDETDETMMMRLLVAYEMMIKIRRVVAGTR